MSDQPSTTDAAQADGQAQNDQQSTEHQNALGAAADDTHEHDDGHEGGSSREAARYRTRLREAEQQRDTLTEQLEAARRQHVEHLVGDRLAVAGDLFTYGETTLADLLSDDGTVDPQKVTDVTDRLLEARPGLAKLRQLWPDLGQGQRDSAPAAPSWGDVMKRR